MNFLPENSIWGTFTKFHGKNVLCEKGDEITHESSIHVHFFSKLFLFFYLENVGGS
jgi:hypothetical protein